MRILSRQIKEMPRSGIRVIMDMAAQQSEVFHLELGEPGFPTPDHIQEGAIQAVRQGFTKYTQNCGFFPLREAIVKKVREENRIEVEVDQVAATPGSVFGIVSAMMTVTEPGDELLLPDPGWPNYFMQAVSLGLKPVYYPLSEKELFQPNMQKLESLINERTRAIITNSPSNPTGAVFSRQTMENLLGLANRHDLYIISDEVYERILYGTTHISPASLDTDDRVFSIFGFSKTYAMTGWRIGYCIAPKTLRLKCTRFWKPLSRVPRLSRKKRRRQPCPVHRIV